MSEIGCALGLSTGNKRLDPFSEWFRENSLTMPTVSDLAVKIRNGRKYAIFLGAGSSACSSIPTAPGVIDLLREKYPGRDLGSSYADVMKRAFRRKSDRRAFFEDLCAGKVPCQHHYQLAELTEREIFTVIYTTNFDRLIETALFFYCSVPPAVYLHDVEFGEAELHSPDTKVLKLHGDFLFEAIANVPTELRAKLRANMRRKLVTYLETHGLVVLGYGGGDETIMAVLEEAIRAPACLRPGLFWVEKKTEPREEVARLLSLARSHGKGGYLVRSTDADRFFDSLGAELGVRAHQTPRFGLSEKRQASPVVGCTYMFPHARHLLPKPKPTSRRRSSTIARSIQEITDALCMRRVTWLVGSTPNPEEMLGTALAKRRARPLFYFNYHFARNQPPSKNLYHGLVRFATAYGVPLAGESHTSVVRKLFMKRAIVVLANSLRRVSIPDGGWDVSVDPSYWNYICEILAAHYEVGRGIVVLIEPCEPTPELLAGIRNAKASSSLPTTGVIIHRNSVAIGLGGSVLVVGGETRPDDLGIRVVRMPDELDREPVSPMLTSLAPAERTFLSQLRSLRFGETSPAIARLTRQTRVERLLEHLADRGLVDRQGDRYRPRERLQQQLVQTAPIGNSERIEFAKQFERLATEAARGHDLNWDHYHFEAEHHYFAAGKPKLAAAVLTRTDPMAFARSEWASWFAATLRDFFLLEGAGKKVLRQLPPDQRHTLLLTFDIALDTSGIPKDENVNRGREKVLNSLGREYRDFTLAKAHQLKEEYTEAIDLFEKIIQHLLKGSPSPLLGFSQSSVGECLYQRALVEWAEADLDQGKNKFLLAYRTFHKLGMRLEEAMALDNLSFYHHRRGNHVGGLKFALRALKILHREPGFSPRKGVVYHNAAAGYLHAGDIGRAEGFFMESAFHYMMVGDFDGLARLYFTLFGWANRLPREKPLSMSRLYKAAFLTWGYARPPRVLGEMISVNEQYLEHSLKTSNLPGVARAIDDFGYIARDAPTETRLEVTLPRIAKAFERWSQSELRRVILRRVGKSGWWTDDEKRKLSDFFESKESAREKGR